MEATTKPLALEDAGVDVKYIKEKIANFNTGILDVTWKIYNHNQKRRNRISDLSLQVGFTTDKKSKRYDTTTGGWISVTELVTPLYIVTDTKTIYKTEFFPRRAPSEDGSLDTKMRGIIAEIMRHGLSHYVKKATSLPDDLI